jgi:UDP-3-O-acyl-N-acetylglucosamine deacetylase
MQNQRTLRNDIVIDGIDLPSENHSTIEVYRASPNTGFVFVTSKGNNIEAKLENAYPTTFPIKTIYLQNNSSNERIAVPEHTLAQLYAYGIDNAIIKVNKTSSLTSRAFKNLGNARNTTFIPYVGRKLCDALENNIEEQDAPRKILRLRRPIVTEKLSLSPTDGEEVEISAYTSYKLSNGERTEQKKSLIISPQSIRDISTARNYCGVPLWSPKWFTKLVASFVFLSHGFGNGNDDSNVFYSAKTRDSWLAKELMESEIACHTIMDRLGELALLQGRLQGVYAGCKFAGHRDAIETIKNNLDKFYIYN